MKQMLIALVWLSGSLVLAGFASGQASLPQHSEGTSHRTAPDGEVGHRGLMGLRPLVNPGGTNTAIDYYNRIEGPLQVVFIDEHPTPATTLKATTLDGLLVYLGYQNATGDGLKAADLEGLNSTILMPTNAGEFATLDRATSGRIGRHLALADFWDAATNSSKILVSRFFAPKIVTYYNQVDPFEPVDPDTLIAGWRKLARLPPRSGSRGSDANLRYGLILFNFKKATADQDPFAENESGNNQVILVPNSFDSKTEDAAYFAVDQKKSLGYPLGLFLGADFDLPGHAAYQSSGGVAADSQYFVPTSCAACHGHGDSQGAPDATSQKFNLAKPNYLDTDQWYDWMDFDYHGVAGSLHDVVFDGGKDHGDATYRRAFNVMSAINLGIKADVERAEPAAGGPSFALRAVNKWLALHAVDSTTGLASDALRKPYSIRALADIAGGGWDPANAKEMRLLRLLDNHCFRCHSSMIYNVFDKPAVDARAKTMRTLLNTVMTDAKKNPLPGYAMPQGRVLPGATRAEMSKLLTDIFLTPTIRKSSAAVKLTIVGRNHEFQIAVDGGATQVNPTVTVKRGAAVAISITSALGTHDWVLEDSSGRELTRTERVDGATPKTHSFTADVLGEHTYFCSVGSHRVQGMEGKFIVEP